jgi:hypothetical protein
MALLYYWRPDNYLRDRAFGFGYHLNQGSPALARLYPGDSLWAFTRRKRDRLYVIAAELVVRAVTRNPPNYRYGEYRVWGDLDQSRYFDIDVGPNAELLIRQLHVAAHAQFLAQSFQGHAAVREISNGDHQLLALFAQNLKTLDRVSLYPEDEFEARLIHGESALAHLVAEEPAEYTTRLEYLYKTVDIQHARRNIVELQELYGGRCQVCLFDPRERYDSSLCHGHHIQWLSRGGEDTLANMLLICPNHHAAVHRGDAPFDFQTLQFIFANGLVEKIQMNRHLQASA